MLLRPICEPVELPLHASVIAERVIVAPDAPNIGRFPHFHDVAELVFFRRVLGEFVAAGRRHELSDGCVVFVPSMHQHDFALQPGPMEWLLVQVDPYMVERLALAQDLPSLSHPFCAEPTGRNAARIEMLAEWLQDLVTERPSGSAIQRVTDLLLLSIAQIPVSGGQGLPEARSQPERLLPALERLRTAPAQPLSLDSAATLCGLSAPYFSRRFRQLFGMPFSDYSRIYRLHLAARRLVGSGDSIAEIAFGVGFSTPAHFGARFRERFGMTPREYRASARGQSFAQGRESA